MPWCWGVVALCNGSLQLRVVRQESFQGWDFEVASFLACWWSPFTEATAQESARIAAQNRLAPGIFQLPEVQYLGLWSNWKGSQPANKQTVWITLNDYNHIYDDNIISKKDKGWWYDDRTNYIFHYICVHWFLWTQAYGGSWRQTFWRQALLGKRLTRKWYVPQYNCRRGPSCLITWFLQATTTRKLNSE